jgi:hypothetical protein
MSAWQCTWKIELATLWLLVKHICQLRHATSQISIDRSYWTVLYYFIIFKISSVYYFTFYVLGISALLVAFLLFLFSHDYVFFLHFWSLFLWSLFWLCFVLPAIACQPLLTFKCFNTCSIVFATLFSSLGIFLGWLIRPSVLCIVTILACRCECCNMQNNDL